MIDLETHIQDVLGVIEYEDLRDFILVGHSYGGIVLKNSLRLGLRPDSLSPGDRRFGR
jgi:hypothetical protein